MLGETITATILSLGIIAYFIISLFIKIDNFILSAGLFLFLIILSWVVRDNLRILNDPDKMRKIFDERDVLIDLKAAKITVFVMRWTLILIWAFGPVTYMVLFIYLLLIESFVVYKLSFKYFDKRS
jgi:hypothetical protein